MIKKGLFRKFILLIVCIAIIIPTFYNAHYSKGVYASSTTTHVWEVYNTIEETGWVPYRIQTRVYSGGYYDLGWSDYVMDFKTGEITLTGTYSNHSVTYRLPGHQGSIPPGTVLIKISNFNWEHDFQYFGKRQETRLAKGNILQEYIHNTNRNAYPDDGPIDTLWYVYLGTNSLPTLSLTTSNNLVLSEQPGYNSYILTGTVRDQDVGDTITLKYTIDGVPGHANRTFRTLTSNGNNQSYNYSIPIDSTIPQGNHTIRVWAEDNKGGVSTQLTRSFMVDKTRPNITAGPQNRENWDTSQVDVNVNMNDTLSGMQLRQYELTTSSTPTGNWMTANNNSFNILINSEGEWYLHLRAMDVAGNVDQKTFGIYRFFNFLNPDSIQIVSSGPNHLDINWNNQSDQEYQIRLINQDGSLVFTSDWGIEPPFKIESLTPNSRYTPEIRTRKFGVVSDYIPGLPNYTDANPVRRATFEALDRAIKITLDIEATGNPSYTTYIVKNMITNETIETSREWSNTDLLNDMEYTYMAKVVNRNGKEGEWFYIGTGHTAITKVEVPVDWEDPVGGLTPIKIPEEFDPDTIEGKVVEFNGELAIVVKGRYINIEMSNILNAAEYAISLDGFGYSDWKDVVDNSFSESIFINNPGLYKVHVKFRNQFGHESKSYIRHFLVDWVPPNVETKNKTERQTATTTGAFVVVGYGTDNLSPVLYNDGNGWRIYQEGQDINIFGLTTGYNEIKIMFSDYNGNITIKTHNIWYL